MSLILYNLNRILAQFVLLMSLSQSSDAASVVQKINLQK